MSTSYMYRFRLNFRTNNKYLIICGPISYTDQYTKHTYSTGQGKYLYIYQCSWACRAIKYIIKISDNLPASHWYLNVLIFLPVWFTLHFCLVVFAINLGLCFENAWLFEVSQWERRYSILCIFATVRFIGRRKSAV